MAPKKPHTELSQFQKLWLAKLRKERSYTFQQCRQAFWEYFDVSPDQYKLPDSTLSLILGKKNIESWASIHLDFAVGSIIPEKEAKYPLIEHALHYRLVEKSERRSCNVSEALLREQAQAFAVRMGVDGLKFLIG